MPRIRKKTSKRGTTRQREKIKHKVAEERRKTKKQARKDKASGKVVQKRSKKDPGIPNDFPYKDRILAEVEEQRRQKAAEKQRRKGEKLAVAAGDDGHDPDKSPSRGDAEVGGEDGQGFDGIRSLRAAAMRRDKEGGGLVKERTPGMAVFPGPRTVREAVEKADVVLHVVDARDPVAGMSEVLTEAAGGRLTVVLNKADTVPEESLAEWLAHLRASHVVVPFRVSSAFLPRGALKPATVSKDDAVGLAGLWTHLDDVLRGKNGEELVVAVTGVTNAGKSAVINSILGADVLSVYDVERAGSVKGPSTTTCAAEVVVCFPGDEARRVRFVDTPGLRFAEAEGMSDEDREVMRARDVLLRCRGRLDLLKDPMFAVRDIVSRADTRDLMLAYDLPAFVQGDAAGFLSGVARAGGLVRKRGVLDRAGAARVVLRDWCTGKFRRYTAPGNVESSQLGFVRLVAGTSDKRDPIDWNFEVA